VVSEPGRQGKKYRPNKRHSVWDPRLIDNLIVFQKVGGDLGVKETGKEGKKKNRAIAAIGNNHQLGTPLRLFTEEGGSPSFLVTSYSLLLYRETDGGGEGKKDDRGDPESTTRIILPGSLGGEKARMAQPASSFYRL